MTLTTHRLPSYSEALDYDRLPEPWCEWAKIASSFIRQLDDQFDREDLMHDIIVRCYEVAEEYRQQGRSLSKWGAIKVAEYTRLRFYHRKKRWKRVSSFDLNCQVKDEDGNETEFIDTLIALKKVDQDTWLDAQGYYLSSPERVKQAIQKLLKYGAGKGNKLSGYDWKLIRQFREQYKALA